MFQNTYIFNNLVVKEKKNVQKRTGPKCPFARKGKKMTDFKNIIAKAIANATNIGQDEIYGYIEVPKDTSNGDYAFPCFKLAKTLKKAPQQIALELKEKISIITKIY